MSFLKNFGKIFSSAPARSERSLLLYVQCSKCGEKLRARVDVWNDLTAEYDGKSDSAASYHCRKVLVGDKRCYQPIELTLKFDKNHQLVEKHIHGGRFIDEAEFNNQES